MWRASLVGMWSMVVLAACASSSPKPFEPPEQSYDDYEMAPLPYEIADIRAAMPVGFVYTYKIDSPLGLTYSKWEIMAVDDEGCTATSTSLTEAGVVADVRTLQMTWIETIDAGFPKESATRDETEIETALGKHAVWRYVIGEMEQGVPSTTTLYYAKKRPGPPILMELRRGEEVMRLEMVPSK